MMSYNVERSQHDNDIAVILIDNLPKLIDVVRLIRSLDGDETSVQPWKLDETSVGLVEVRVVFDAIGQFNTIKLVLKANDNKQCHATRVDY